MTRKVTMTAERKDGKIIVTYFTGEYSEWFIGLPKASTDTDVVGEIFGFIVKLLDKATKDVMIQTATALTKNGRGIHLTMPRKRKK